MATRNVLRGRISKLYKTQIAFGEESGLSSHKIGCIVRCEKDPTWEEAIIIKNHLCYDDETIEELLVKKEDE